MKSWMWREANQRHSGIHENKLKSVSNSTKAWGCMQVTYRRWYPSPNSHTHLPRDSAKLKKETICAGEAADLPAALPPEDSGQQIRDNGVINHSTFATKWLLPHLSLQNYRGKGIPRNTLSALLYHSTSPPHWETERRRELGLLVTSLSCCIHRLREISCQMSYFWEKVYF